MGSVYLGASDDREDPARALTPCTYGEMLWALCGTFNISKEVLLLGASWEFCYGMSLENFFRNLDVLV